MTEPASTGGDGKVLRVWLVRCLANSMKCFICHRIAEENTIEAGALKAIRISGIELTSETQLAHLARCVGQGEERA